MTDLRARRVWGPILAHARAEGLDPTTKHALAACVQATGAIGAGLSVSRGRGLREPILAVGERSEELEELQFTLGEGPAVDAADGDRPVLVADLAGPEARRRWPAFASGAAARDVLGMFAFPVGAGAARLGVLDVYRTAPGNLDTIELADALAYGDAVLVLALDHRSGLGFDAEKLPDGDLAARRAEVHQAAGMVSVQLGVSVAEALARLRAYSYVNDLALADIAAGLVTRRFRFLPDANTSTTTDGDGNMIMEAPPIIIDDEETGEDE